jgi:hypothetical protein
MVIVRVAILELFQTAPAKKRHPGAENIKAALTSREQQSGNDNSADDDAKRGALQVPSTSNRTPRQLLECPTRAPTNRSRPQESPRLLGKLAPNIQSDNKTKNNASRWTPGVNVPSGGSGSAQKHDRQQRTLNAPASPIIPRNQTFLHPQNISSSKSKSGGRSNVGGSSSDGYGNDGGAVQFEVVLVSPKAISSTPSVLDDDVDDNDDDGPTTTTNGKRSHRLIKRSGFHVLVVPGGSSGRQARDLGERLRR